MLLMIQNIAPKLNRPVSHKASGSVINWVFVARNTEIAGEEISITATPQILSKSNSSILSVILDIKLRI
jgi:hypothetical protein